MPRCSNKRFEISLKAIMAVYTMVLFELVFFPPLMLLSKMMTRDEVSAMVFDIYMILPIISLFVAPVVLLVQLNKKLCSFDDSPESAVKVNKFLINSKRYVIGTVIFVHFFIGLGLGSSAEKTGLAFANFSQNHLFVNVTLSYYGLALMLAPISVLIYLIEVERPLNEIPYEAEYKTSSVRSRLWKSITTILTGLLCSVASIIMILGSKTSVNIYQTINNIVPMIITAAASILVCVKLNTDTINKELKKVRGYVESFSNRDYSVENLPIETRNEFGLLQKNLNDLKGITSTIMTELRDEIEGTLKVTDEIHHNIETSSEKIESVTKTITSVKEEMNNQAAGVEEASATTNQIMQRIQELNQAIENQSAGVEQSTAAVEEMVANINSVGQILEKNSLSVNSLSAASEEGKKKVEAAVSTSEEVITQSSMLIQASKIIQDIASRTNLLAMNAAIESAHAGEAGKGFAVVAAEIRTLAEQCSKQAKNIDESLHALSDSIGQVSVSTKDVKQQFDVIYGFAQEVQNQGTVIQNAMAEQNEGNKQVLDGIRAINNATVIVKEGSEEMLHGGQQICEEMKILIETTHTINTHMENIKENVSDIYQSISITEEHAESNKSGVLELKNELNKFKL